MDSKFIGKYYIHRQKLGKGHFADVMLAHHRPTKMKVAVKIIELRKIWQSSYLAKNLKREAEILSKLDHPGIIKLFEIHQTQTHYFLFLELGSSDMVDFINDNPEFPAKKLDDFTGKNIGRQLASAVAHIHSRGFVHRDIKLENILINPNTHRIKLIDFGLSNIYDPNSFLTTKCGSPEYAAPELSHEDRYDSKVDVWSVGIVFFTMMVGHLPFKLPNCSGMSFSEQKNLIKDMNANGIKSAEYQKKLSGTSPAFQNLLGQMLESNPEERCNIHQVEQHCWLTNHCRDREEQLAEFDADQKRKEIQRIAEYFKLPYKYVKKQIKDASFGPVHGMFNIRKYNYQHRLDPSLTP